MSGLKYPLITSLGFSAFILCAFFLHSLLQSDSNSQDLRLTTDEFISASEKELEALSQLTESSQFLAETNPSPELRQAARQALEQAQRTRGTLAREAAIYLKDNPTSVQRRRLNFIRTLSALPTPQSESLRRELTGIREALIANYRDAEICKDRTECRPRHSLYRILRTSRNTQELLSAWQEWHANSTHTRAPFTRLVELSNLGAQEIGFADVGEMWRSRYEVPPEKVERDITRIWSEVRPLYDALHCHTHARLQDRFGADSLPGDHIPAHLLGHMWGQYWTGIEDLLAPEANASTLNVTDLLIENKISPIDMFQMGERFFLSLGFDPLPTSFWRHSVIEAPTTHPIACQASAWPIDLDNRDVRIKMCTEVNATDFQTVHHELGHIYYYLAYAHQSPLFRRGADPALHETIGDTIALSLTPSYFQQLGLTEDNMQQDDLAFLLNTALDKLPRLAFGVALEQWRWGVFSGEITPNNYNASWWGIRETVQGITSPTPLTEETFDAGMFLHLVLGAPYENYSLALVQQFDVHRALCRATDHEGALHRCSIFGNQTAGNTLQETLAIGATRPAREVYEQLTGRRQTDAQALLEYFSPLQEWLEQVNRQRHCPR